MIKPVNSHILIEPVVHEEFIASQTGSYQEIGTVISVDEKVPWIVEFDLIGKKIYFDSWLAAKYPKPNGKDGDFYWLVKYEDVRAVEHGEPQVSEQ